MTTSRKVLFFGHVLALAVGASACQSAVAADRKAPDAGASRPVDGGAAVTLDQCLDRWTTEQHLNAYGDPPDTTYAGGTPLFDERTGRRRDRADYLYAKHPEAKARCANAR